MLEQGEDCPITPGSQANTPPVFSESRRRWVWLVSNAQLAVLITYALSLKSNQENLRMLTRKQGSSWPENRVRKASVDCAHGKREEPAHAQACFTMVRFSPSLEEKSSGICLFTNCALFPRNPGHLLPLLCSERPCSDLFTPLSRCFWVPS